MSESLARPVGRFFELFLSITLTLPNPAFALRESQEDKAVLELAAALGGPPTAPTVSVQPNRQGPSKAGTLEEITLKNGAVEAELLVRVMMLSLQSLMEKDPIVFYELVMKARDPNHQFWGNTADTLKGLSLVQPDGRLHESIRNVVVSAVVGEGLDMTLTSPVKAGMEEGEARIAAVTTRYEGLFKNGTELADNQVIPHLSLAGRKITLEVDLNQLGDIDPADIASAGRIFTHAENIIPSAWSTLPREALPPVLNQAKDFLAKKGAGPTDLHLLIPKLRAMQLETGVQS